MIEEQSFTKSPTRINQCWTGHLPWGCNLMTMLWKWKLAWPLDVVGMGLALIRGSCRGSFWGSCDEFFQNQLQLAPCAASPNQQRPRCSCSLWCTPPTPFASSPASSEAPGGQSILKQLYITWWSGGFMWDTTVINIHGGLWTNVHIRATRTLQVGRMTKDENRIGISPGTKKAHQLHIGHLWKHSIN